MLPALRAVRSFLALVVVGGALFGAFRLFAGLQKEVAAALLTGAAVVAAALIARYSERRLQRESAIRESKVQFYDQFIPAVLLLGGMIDLSQVEEDLGLTHAEASIARLKRISAEFLTWADSSVVEAWAFLRRDIPVVAPNEILAVFEAVIAAIRKDLGHSDKPLMPGDLLSIFLNDIPPRGKVPEGVKPRLGQNLVVQLPVPPVD